MKERKKLRDIHPSHVIFDTLNTIFMILLSIICIYPLWYTGTRRTARISAARTPSPPAARTSLPIPKWTAPIIPS